MNLKLPPINAQAFSRGLVTRRGSRGIAKFLEMVGPDVCRKIVEAKTPLSTLLSPEQLAQYQHLAGQYYWLANLITDIDFVLMLPPWFQEIIRTTPGGLQWLKEQVAWIRTLFVPPS